MTATLAADDANGIKSLRLMAAARELGRKDAACDYARMRPCPGSLGETFSFDVGRLPDGTHELQAIATDASDQTSVATSSIRVDRTAPGAPNGLTAAANQDGSYALAWTNPDQGTAAPIVAARYAVCDAAPVPVCEPEQRVVGAGLERIGAVAVPVGKGVVRVWLEDEAGNVDPANAAVVATSAQRSPRVLDTNPPVLLPTGPGASPRLKVTKARRAGSTLTLSGTVARGATARITAKVARTRSGRALVSARVKPRRGKWSMRLRLPAGLRAARTMHLTLSTAEQADFRRTTVRRTLSRSRPGRSNTAVEFSIETPRRK